MPSAVAPIHSPDPRAAIREAGKDVARAFLLSVVKGNARRSKILRERIIAAKALLYEKADASRKDSHEEQAQTQQNRFDQLLQAVADSASP